MILLIIDDEPTWIAFLQANFPGATLDPAAPWQLAVVSARLMRDPERVPPAIWQRGAVVATGQETTPEVVKAFMLGALDYFKKDFRAEKVEAILDGVTFPAGVR